jgi:hypothetical protein
MLRPDEFAQSFDNPPLPDIPFVDPEDAGMSNVEDLKNYRIHIRAGSRGGYFLAGTPTPFLRKFPLIIQHIFSRNRFPKPPRKQRADNGNTSMGPGSVEADPYLSMQYED